MARMVDRTCGYIKCDQGEGRTRKVFQARSADVKRGWGIFCCKTCKAKEQEMRTGQNAAFKNGRGVSHAAELRGSNHHKRKHKGQDLTDVHPTFPQSKMNYQRIKDNDNDEHNYMGSHVSKEVFMEYQQEYGGHPEFTWSGNYIGSYVSGANFDNSEHQNND